MRWSILILTQPKRARLFDRIRGLLLPQLAPYENRVELLSRLFNPNQSLGENRQTLLDAAWGEYVSFIDDDDTVARDYVERIFPLLDGVDYVGFRLQLYVNGVRQKPTFHSLQYADWRDDDKGFYRDLSHLNPIRRELALLVPFEGGRGEDFSWAERLRATGRVKTEHFIPEVMYHYWFRS